MKHFLSITLQCIALCLACGQEGNSEELASKDLKPFNAQSGIIEYEITGDGAGKATLIFSQWGWQQKTETQYTYSQYGVSSEEQRITLRNGDFLYDVKPPSTAGKRTKDKSISDLLGYKSRDEAWAASFLSKGGIMTGKEDLLGLECQVWTFEKGSIKKLWVSNGLILKSEKKIGKLQIITTASKVDLDASVEANQFLLAGIDWSN